MSHFKGSWRLAPCLESRNGFRAEARAGSRPSGLQPFSLVSLLPPWSAAVESSGGMKRAGDGWTRFMQNCLNHWHDASSLGFPG